MRQVKAKKVPSRTGVRAVSAKTVKKRSAAKAQPSKRASLAERRAVSRRRDRDLGLFGRIVADLREGNFPMHPFTAGAVAMIAGVIVYGLVIGGHVTNAKDAVVDQVNHVLALSGFNVQEVTVKGRSHADAKALLAALGVGRGDPIMGFDTEAARQRVEQVDWVERATVTRMLPDHIQIDIQERQPFAIWQRGGQLSVIDSQGRSITDHDVQEFASLPFVVGFGAARHAEDIVKLVRDTQPQLFARVRAFVRVGDRRWNMRLENGVDVKLPEVGVEAALAELVTLENKYKLLARDIQAVDLRLPDRVAVQLSEQAAGDKGIAIGASVTSQDLRQGGALRPVVAAGGGNT
ncbi:MAG: FtsQ-type POTRA domain-containing protein [Rhizobiales bacterium]|nr:FtsQ-type POTRA domain-containing protein [Hyphomicrobiales bacterium]